VLPYPIHSIEWGRLLPHVSLRGRNHSLLEGRKGKTHLLIETEAEAGHTMGEGRREQVLMAGAYTLTLSRHPILIITTDGTSVQTMVSDH
jgi:hypothetical protein